jgi:DNA replication protein DnaC
MFDNPTGTKLREMNLKTMARMLSDPEPGEKEMTFEDRFGLMVEREWLSKHNSRIDRLMRAATLGVNACVEDIDYGNNRTIDKQTVRTLATGMYIEQKLNVVITGKTGSGKSYLACALAHNACRQEIPVKYYRVPELLLEFSAARASNKYHHFMQSLLRARVLVLDDIGLKSYDNVESRDMLELAESRYNKASTIFVSQIPHSDWYELFSDSTLADAFLDRIIHNTYVLPLDSELSMREIAAQKLLNFIGR